MPSDQSRRNPRSAEHLGETVTSLRTLVLLGGPLMLLLSIAETFWYAGGKYGSFVYLLLLGPGNLLMIWGLAALIERVAGGTAKVFAKTVLGGGNIAPDPGFSAEETMIIQGRLDDAESALRQRLAAEPELHPAALRLGALLLQMGRPDEAERVYLELRHHQLPQPVAMTLANRLIDLYHREGRSDRLMVELARFSEDHKGTGAGEHAARRLRELQEEAWERKDAVAED